MIQDREIADIARQIAKAKHGQQAVEDAISEPIINSQGREALRITIVVKPNKVSGLKGDAILDTLVEIQNKLLNVGEERSAIVEYATKKELAESGSN